MTDPALYRRASRGEEIAELAREVGVTPFDLGQRLEAYAHHEGKHWPPYDRGRALYEARIRSWTASRRLGLRGTRAGQAATWTTAIEEVGLDLGDDPTKAEKSASTLAKIWAWRNDLPWGREFAPRLWTRQERTKGGFDAHDRLQSALGDAYILREIPTTHILIIDVYASRRALYALETLTATPDRPYHLARKLAGVQLADLLSDLVERSGETRDHWREVVEDALSAHT